MEEDYENQALGVSYEQGEVHSWRPPCSCGVELAKVVDSSEVHSWRPPCSCGVSLDGVIEEE